MVPVGNKDEIVLPILKTFAFGLVSLVSLFQLIDLLLFQEIRVYQDRITKVWKWIGARDIKLASASLTASVPGGNTSRTICDQNTKWYLRGVTGIFYDGNLADPKEVKKLNSLLAYLSGRRIREFEEPATTRRLIKEGDGPRSAIGYTFDERLLNEVASERAFNRIAGIGVLVLALFMILGACILWYPIVRALF